MGWGGAGYRGPRACCNHISKPHCSVSAVTRIIMNHVLQNTMPANNRGTFDERTACIDSFTCFMFSGLI